MWARRDRPPAGGDQRATPSVVRRALRRFIIGSVLALLLVGLASVVVAKNLADDAELREALLRGSAFADGVAGPLVNEGVRRGDVQQLAVLDYVMRSRLRDGSIVHIKVLSRDGTVMWSDVPQVVGKSSPPDPGVTELFATGGVVGGVSTFIKSADPKAPGEGPLLEIYAGSLDADAVPVVVATYWSLDRVDDAERATLNALVPLALGSLILFQLAVLPLAMSLARRVDHGLAERGVMVQHALSASELERHRIAEQLHDGVIQDLAGIGFALPTVAASLTPGADRARQVLDQTSALVRRDVEALRSMLTELYPASLAEGELVAAVQDLVDRAELSGVTMSAQVSSVPDESLTVTRLAYRIVREGIHNVVKHAGAANALVTAGREGAVYVVTVTDDGKGIGPGDAPTGHVGLRLLGDTLRDIGGSLTVANASVGGTVLTARFPVNLTDPERIEPERIEPNRGGQGFRKVGRSQ